MSIGTHPIGTRSLGDSTGDVGLAPAVPPTVVNASVSFTVQGLFTQVSPRTFATVAYTIETTLVPTGATKIDGGRVAFTVESAMRVRSLIRGRDYRAVLADLAGERYAEFPVANMGDLSWEMNGPGAFQLDLAQGDPRAEAVIPIERQLHVYKGEALLWAGPIVRPIANAREAQVPAATDEWFFHRRNFGKADRKNYIPNGDFEQGLAHWSIGYSNPIEPIAGRSPAHWIGRIEQNRVLVGTRSLYLEQKATGQPKYGMSAGQHFEWQVDPGIAPDGDAWTLTAYCWIDSAKWRGPNLARAGMGLGRFSTTETVLIGPEGGGAPALAFPRPIEGVMVTLDDYTPRDRWVRMSASMEQRPTGQVELVTIRLDAPDGGIYWDRVSLTLQEATIFRDVDQALICKGIVEHLQDPAYGKSDLGIGTRCEPTGIKRDRTYTHSEHGKGLEALQEFPSLDNGLDFSVEITPKSKTFVTHFPQKGADMTDIVLEWGRNIEDFTEGWDGEAAASSVIALGTGDGSSREEGFAEDPSLYGGITLEDVFVAPEPENYSNIETLDNRAAERLRLVRNPTILEVQAREAVDAAGRKVPLVGVLSTGDRVTVRIHRGVTHIEAIYRIVRMVLNPGRDLLTLSMNWWADNA